MLGLGLEGFWGCWGLGWPGVLLFHRPHAERPQLQHTRMSQAKKDSNCAVVSSSHVGSPFEAFRWPGPVTETFKIHVKVNKVFRCKGLQALSCPGLHEATGIYVLYATQGAAKNVARSMEKCGKARFSIDHAVIMPGVWGFGGFGARRIWLEVGGLGVMPELQA